MKTNRRKFIKSAVAGSIGVTAFPILSFCKSEARNTGYEMDIRARYKKLDEIRRKPVLRRELFPEPVIIETIEYLRDRNNFLVRVRSKDGAEGISAGHSFQSRRSYPAMQNLQQSFIGQDARDLDALIPDQIHGKIGGISYNVQLATLEIAILDMLGNTVNRPIGQLLGEIHNPEITFYQGSRYLEQRRLPPEESIELIKQDLEVSKAKAIKMRPGVSSGGKLDGDLTPGHSEKLIRMARETFGDEMVLMCDGNNYYSTEGAIRFANILEEYNYYWWEEPVPFGWNDEQKIVKDALAPLNIKYATGESEAHTSTFRWLIANDALDICQPDTLYFGGMIRTMKVARMAEVFGKTSSPHMSSNGFGYLYMLQLVSAMPNADKYQEFKLFTTYDANGNQIPIESKTEPFTSNDGVIKVPTGSGLGIIIDPDYIKKHKVVNYV